MEWTRDFPWSAILTGMVMLWAIGSLAFIERLRRTFATPRELEQIQQNIGKDSKAMEDRLCGLIEKLQDRSDRLEHDLKEWERQQDRSVAKRGEVDGLGSRVGNLEHMFTSTQKIAEEAREMSKEAQTDIRHLTAEVTKSTSKVDAAVVKVDTLLIQFAEMRTEMRMMFGKEFNSHRNKE